MSFRRDTLNDQRLTFLYSWKSAYSITFKNGLARSFDSILNWRATRWPAQSCPLGSSVTWI